ncbi:hypothetical protein BLOT_001508 [Blomia tropicalis]|nr:hypothetical protein BLOT_001508 [Blomia tropicalis]
MNIFDCFKARTSEHRLVDSRRLCTKLYRNVFLARHDIYLVPTSSQLYLSTNWEAQTRSLPPSPTTLKVVNRDQSTSLHDKMSGQ